MVLYRSVTIPLLQLTKDNQMDACFQAKVASTGELRSPSCCQVTFNHQQIFCMCCLAIMCHPWVLGTAVWTRRYDLFLWLLLSNTSLWRTVLTVRGKALLARRCDEKAYRYFRWWRLVRWEWNFLYLEDVKCLGALNWDRLRSAEGTHKGRRSSSHMVA